MLSSVHFGRAYSHAYGTNLTWHSPNNIQGKEISQSIKKDQQLKKQVFWPWIIGASVHQKLTFVPWIRFIIGKCFGYLPVCRSHVFPKYTLQTERILLSAVFLVPAPEFSYFFQPFSVNIGYCPNNVVTMLSVVHMTPRIKQNTPETGDDLISGPVKKANTMFFGI